MTDAKTLDGLNSTDRPKHNRKAVPTDRQYMTHHIDTRSAIVHLDVTTVEPENTGNTYEFPHSSPEDTSRDRPDPIEPS